MASLTIDKSIIGKSSVSFTNEQTGKPVLGTKIFYCTKISSNKGSGFWCDKAFVRHSVVPFEQIVIGKECEILYDRFGKVSGIRYTDET